MSKPTLVDKVRKLMALNRHTLILLPEALLFLGFARAAVFFCNPKCYLGLMGKRYDLVAADAFEHTSTILRKHWSDNDGERHIPMVKEITSSVGIISRFAPWESVCLPRAMTVKWMLKRRGFQTQLYLGIKKTDNNRGLDAHAWLMADELLITGREQIEQFTPISKYE